MAASVRALFACGSGRKTLVLLGLVRSFIARQPWKKHLPNSDAYVTRELTTTTAIPTAVTQTTLKTVPSSFLHLAAPSNTIVKNSLPLAIFSSTATAPSFGASALVAQDSSSRNNKENLAFFNGKKSFLEQVADHLKATATTTEENNKMKKTSFSNKTNSTSMDALREYARMGLPPLKNTDTQVKGESKVDATNTTANALLNYALL